MSDIDFAQHIGEVAQRLLGHPNRALSGATEWRYGTNGSLSVDLAKGTWFDHENQVGGGVLDLIKHETGLANGAAVGWLRDELGIDVPASPSPRKATANRIIAMYDYQDELGSLLYQLGRAP